MIGNNLSNSAFFFFSSKISLNSVLSSFYILVLKQDYPDKEK